MHLPSLAAGLCDSTAHLGLSILVLGLTACAPPNLETSQFASNWGIPLPEPAPVYPASGAYGFSSHTVTDWDGDGALDLFVGSSTASTPGLFRQPNVGGLIFSSPSSSLGGQVGALSSTDWDRDGRPDLGVGYGSGVVAIYDNDAFDSPVPRWSTLNWGRQQDLRWVDYNTDGNPDLSIIGTPTTGLHPYQLVQGQPAMGIQTSLPPLGPQEEMLKQAWADFDLDGDLDLALCIDSAQLAPGLSHIEYWENTVGGWSQVGIDQSLGLGFCHGLEWADFDQDGDFDLAVAVEGSPSRLITNEGPDSTGATSFVQSCVFHDELANPTGFDAGDVVWGDWDADGRPDLTLAILPDGARFFDNDDLTACLPGHVFPTVWPVFGSQPVALSLADIDGDSLVDLIAVPSAEGYAAQIIRNPLRLPLATRTPQPIEEPGSALAFQWANLSGDPNEELIVLTDDWMLKTFETSPSGLVLSRSQELPQGVEATDFRVADWNHDGAIDVLLLTDEAGGDLILQGLDEEALSVAWESTVSTTADAAWVDIDLDGDLDLLRIDSERGLLLNENNLADIYPDLSPPGDSVVSSYLSADIELLVADNLRQLALADIDQDGDLDIALCGANFIEIYERETNPFAPEPLVSLGTPRWTEIPQGSACTELLWEDLDGDGLPELISASASGHTIIWPGFVLGPSLTLPPEDPWVSVSSSGAIGALSASDLNGDGYPEIAISLETALSPVVQVYSNIEGVPYDVVDFEFFTGGGALTIGDTDRDGDADLLFGRLNAQPLFYNVNNTSNPEGNYVENPTTASLTVLSAEGGSRTGQRLIADAVELTVELRDPEADDVIDYRVEWSASRSRWHQATLVSPPASLSSSPAGSPHVLVWDAAADGLVDDSPVRDQISLRFVIVRQTMKSSEGGPARGAISSNVVRVGLAQCFPFDADGDGAHCSKDCDDENAERYPGAPELCDGLDTSCVGEGWEPGTEDDADGDGIAECEGDCDDEDPSIYPGALELCDEQDNDCNGLDDMGKPNTPGQEDDADGDGLAECDGDCDDTREDIYPGQEDTPEDGIDQDCNGFDSASCFYDGDGDGYGGSELVIAPEGDCLQAGAALEFSDCNDDDESIHPGAIEDCADQSDRDCDGSEAEVGVDPDCWPGSFSGCSTASGSTSTPAPRTIFLLLFPFGVLAARRMRR